jgi:hypothetical protein
MDQEGAGQMKNLSAPKESDGAINIEFQDEDFEAVRKVFEAFLACQ